MKHDITQTLQDYQLTFDTAEHELTYEEFDFEVEALREFYEEHNEDFTDAHESLYTACEGLVTYAEAYFAPIREQEELEYRRELAWALAIEWNH